MLFASSQKGVALITALLIVALATVISVNLSTRLQLDIRRTSNVIAAEQALLYTLEAEYWARRTLRDDRLDNNTDSLDEDWALEIPPLPVEGGTVQGKVTDLQGCFNLNSLYQNNAKNAPAQAIFRRLMQRLNPPVTVDLSQAIIDWIDTNAGMEISDGAEDSYYLNLEKPYRAANRPIQSISELRLIKGFEDAAIIQQSKDWLCAFGVAAKINVNTAPAEVLESLATGMSAATVQDIIDSREELPYESTATFVSKNKLTSIITDTTALSINSDYFLLETEAVIGQARTLMYSVIHRDDQGNTQVIARSQGAY